MQTDYTNSFRIQIGSDAHIGNGHEQQDDICIIKKPNINCIILAVADGHGTYVGKTAANTCTYEIEQFADTNEELLVTNPNVFLENCYEHLHNKVREAFVKQYLRENKDVCVDSEGRVLYRKMPSQPYLHVNGGAMLTIAVFIKGVLYVANVGDCKAILCAKDKVEIITSDHSPDNPSEYKRIRNFRPSPEDPNRAELLFVYDSLSEKQKCRCEQIYKIEEDGTAIARDDVKYYYKSVNRDRGTYVTVPSYHNYPDALASTRAIGNYNMNCFGVTWKPDIVMMDLNDATEEELCIVVASDGIWDNVTDDTMRSILFHESCLKVAREDETHGAIRIVKSMIHKIGQTAQKNFPNHADNMSCVLMYLGREAPKSPETLEESSKKSYE